jgi:hypothetical protein
MATFNFSKIDFIIEIIARLINLILFMLLILSE